MSTSESDKFRAWGYFSIGLSALSVGSHCFVKALIPSNVRKPTYHRLIQINSSRKTIFQLDLSDGYGEPFLIIEDWHYLPLNTIYKGIDYEKGILEKLLKETLYSEKIVVDGIVAPIISSPKAGNIGGIALSSFAGMESFTKELMKLIQQLTPPPYRALKPPIRAEKGYLEELYHGFEFRFADRPYLDDGIVDTVHSKFYEDISKSIGMRGKGNISEYSIFSTLLHPHGEPQGALYDLLSHFSDSEITIPEDLDELSEGGADITKTNKEISEDVYLEVVNKRLINPIIVENEDLIIKQVEKMKQNFKILFEEYIGSKHEYLADGFLYRIVGKLDNNFRRTAQHLARKSEKIMVDEDFFKSAQKLMSYQYERLLEDGHVRAMAGTIKQDIDDDQKSLSKDEWKLHQKIMAFLKENPHSIFEEIHDGIHFETISSDPNKLHKFLDKLKKLNRITYYESTGKYSWV